MERGWLHRGFGQRGDRQVGHTQGSLSLVLSCLMERVMERKKERMNE